MKILITGGHLTPALSVIDYVLEHHPKDRVLFVGREFSQDSAGQKAVERYEIEKRGVPFLSFEAVRLGATFWLNAGRNIQRFFKSITQAKLLLKKQAPDVIMSFGGYVAVPFALAGWLLKIPVVTHEQTMTNGFAHTLISWFARSVAISFSESKQWWFDHKTVVTGNPLRAGVFQARHPRPDWLSAKLDTPLVLVMGGNQGSQFLNTLVAQSLTDLTAQWTVVHQCGRPTAAENTQEVLLRAQNRLSAQNRKRYFVHEWLDEQDLFWLYRHATCAVARAGANSVMELAASRLPSMLVPLPSSRRGEQQKNAQWLQRLGGAIVVDQSVLNSTTFLSSLEKLKTLEPTLRGNLERVNIRDNAAEQLYAVISQAGARS